MAYVYPTNVQNNDTQLLTNEQIQSWREKGFALVNGLLPNELVHQVHKEAVDTLGPLLDHHDFGSGGKLEFPSGMSGCDQVTLHPNLLRAASELLNISISELRLCQSDVWMKRGNPESPDDPQNNDSQRIHCDYGNNTLVHPPSWDCPDAVAMIVYYSDEAEVGGGTAVVPREGADDKAYQWPLIAMPGIGGLPFLNSKTHAEEWMKINQPEMYTFRQELYARERKAKFNQGTVLLYRHDVFHRGTPVLPKQYRVVQNVAYRRREIEWLTTWNQGFARSMYNTGDRWIMEKIVAKSTILQRAVLGFPSPGHAYWNPTTLRAVKARYGCFGFDDAPYEAAMRSQ